MLKIEKYFRIITTLVFIMSSLIIPISVLSVLAFFKYNTEGIQLPLRVFKYSLEILASINLLLAFLVLVKEVRTTKQTGLIVASSFVLLGSFLYGLSGAYFLCFWPMYLTAFILVHSAARATPYAVEPDNQLRRSRKSRRK